MDARTTQKALASIIAIVVLAFGCIALSGCATESSASETTTTIPSYAEKPKNDAKPVAPQSESPKKDDSCETPQTVSIDTNVNIDSAAGSTGSGETAQAPERQAPPCPAPPANQAQRDPCPYPSTCYQAPDGYCTATTGDSGCDSGCYDLATTYVTDEVYYYNYTETSRDDTEAYVAFDYDYNDCSYDYEEYWATN